MRDQLIGYLLDALDPAEHEMVEAQLKLDPQLQQELTLMARSLQPLAADQGHFDPPSGLAHRTCEYVARKIDTKVAVPAAAFLPNRWTLADVVVAAGIFFAASLLFFPAVNQSRFAARLAGCQNNLRQIGMGLINYSTLHNDYFPNVATEGNQQVAGIYAPRLLDHGFISDPRLVVCPASTLAEQTDFRVPTMGEVRAARGAALIQLQQQMGGSYGYNLGYVSNGKYYPTRNLSRPNFAIMADVPVSAAPYFSSNHGGCGQNVLFEDGHVRYQTTCTAQGCADNIFTNDLGEVAAGRSQDDAVLGPSHSKPMLIPVSDPAEPLLNR